MHRWRSTSPSVCTSTPLCLDVKGQMNGFAALDIHSLPALCCRQGGRRSSRCRLHLNFALFCTHWTLHKIWECPPIGYQPCVHIERAGACIDGTRQRFAQQPSGAFQDEWKLSTPRLACGALYASLCTPVCKTEIVPFISVKFLRTTSGLPCKFRRDGR